MDIPPPPPAIAERLAAVRASHQEFIRAYLNAARPAAEAAGKAFAEFARCLRETPPAPPRQDFMFVRDETHTWTALDGVVGVDFGHDPHQPVVAWPRQHGKSAFTFTAEFPHSGSAREVFAWVDEHIRVRQAATVDRLAAELGISAYVARRHFDAVQDLLEQTGIADGYGGLTIPQPVRPTVPAPSR